MKKLKTLKFNPLKFKTSKKAQKELDKWIMKSQDIKANNLQMQFDFILDKVKATKIFDKIFSR